MTDLMLRNFYFVMFKATATLYHMPRHLTHLLPTTQKIDGSDRGASAMTAAVNDIKLKMNKNYMTRLSVSWFLGAY